MFAKEVEATFVVSLHILMVSSHVLLSRAISGVFLILAWMAAVFWIIDTARGSPSEGSTH